jgi:peroxiredoxin
MRKIYWLLLTIGILACSRGEPVRISGKITNAEGMRIYLDEQGLSSIREVDSAKVRHDGSFTLKDRIECPTFYNLHFGDENIVPLLLAPGDRAEIQASYIDFRTDYEISGSDESVYLMDLTRRMAITQKSIDSLSRITEEYPDAPDALLEGISRAYQEIIEKQRRYSIRFILEHRNSMASIYALYQKLDENNYLLNQNRDIQLLKVTAMVLDTIYPESEYVQSLKKDAANLEQELQSSRWKRVIESTPAALPEVNLPDPYGDSIALSSLSGQVILLSFWASWNEESVLHNQDYKRLYDRYHDRGFEIYQVSFDKKLRNWKSAIDFDELPWINVSELSYPESSVARKYNVTELPTNFLINRQGEIVGKNYNRVELDRKIAELILQN